MRTPLRLAAVVGAAVACAVATAGCGALVSTAPAASPASAASTPSAVATAFPLTVTAGDGAVTIKAKPARIVSLSPTATEDLYAVGAGSQVVAVDQDSTYPATAPRTTSLSSSAPDIEAIEKYNPSLVIAAQDSGNLVAGLAKRGVPVLIEPEVATLAAVYDQIEQIGQATGHASQAAKVVARMQNKLINDVTGLGAPSTMTYYVEVSANPLTSATSSTLIGQLIGLFGLTNIADNAGKPDGNGEPKLPSGDIVSARPQIIFLADDGAADGDPAAAYDPAADGGRAQAQDFVTKRRDWTSIPAVQDHEVFGLNEELATTWGTLIPNLVAEIASAVRHAAALAASPTPAG